MLYIMVSIPIRDGQTGNELRLHPLILPSISHTGDLGDAQFQSRGPRRSTCLDLPRDLVLKRLSHLNLLGDLPVPRGTRRSSHLDLPRDSILGRLSCLDLPGDSISRRLSRLSLPGDLHPDPGTPGSQVATVLGRMSLHHIYSHPRWAN